MTRKFIIDGDELEESKFWDWLREDIRESVEENYDDLIDDGYETFKIGYCEFTASEILKNCDPVAYRCGIDDFVDSELSDAQSELDRYGRYDAGKRVYEIVEEDEEEDE